LLAAGGGQNPKPTSNHKQGLYQFLASLWLSVGSMFGTPALQLGTPALHLATPALHFGCFCFPFGFISDRFCSKTLVFPHPNSRNNFRYPQTPSPKEFYLPRLPNVDHGALSFALFFPVPEEMFLYAPWFILEFF
jgi:hypothetical protein